MNVFWHEGVEGGVNSLDLTGSILSGTPRSQITPGQIKRAGVSSAAERGKKKNWESVEEANNRGGEREGGRGRK